MDGYTPFRLEFGDDHPHWPKAWVKIAGMCTADALEVQSEPAAVQLKKLAEHVLDWSFSQPCTPQGIGKLDSVLAASMVAAWLERLLKPIPLGPTTVAPELSAMLDELTDINVGMTAL